MVHVPLFGGLEVDDDLAAADVDVDDGADTAMLTSEPTGIDKVVSRTCGLELKDPEQNCTPVAEPMWSF